MPVAPSSIATWAGLIEAYWNVNELSNDEKAVFSYGLIEAYWNVNIDHRLIDTETLSFNRSILKCKYAEEDRPHCCEIRLIEAYWNVNPNLLAAVHRLDHV